MANCKYYYHRPTGFLVVGTDEGCTRFGANSRIPFDDAVNYNNDYCSTTVDAFLTCPLSVPQTVVEITRMPGSGLCERCSYYVIRNPPSTRWHLHLCHRCKDGKRWLYRRKIYSHVGPTSSSHAHNWAIASWRRRFAASSVSSIVSQANPTKNRGEVSFTNRDAWGEIPGAAPPSPHKNPDKKRLHGSIC